MLDGGAATEQAIAWHLRLPDAARAEWAAFLDWLEADSAHRHAYDRLTLDDALLASPVDAAGASNGFAAACGDQSSGRSPWPKRLAGGGVLCGVLLAGGLSLLGVPPSPAEDRYIVATAPGERRDIQLAGGTRIEMNGGTRLLLDRNDPRFAQLDAGEAMFRVRHDASHPFALHSGETELRDLGTVFNVDRDGARLRVEVGEGAVIFRPEQEAVVLRPGSQLTLREDLDRVTIGRVAAETVGSWRHGWLVVHDMPVASVAKAVERATATRLVVAPELAEMPFTGSLRLDGGADRLVPRIAQLLDVRWSRDKNGWRLSSQDHGTHLG